MSWRRQLTPALLRHNVPPLSGSCSVLSSVQLLSGVRFSSQFSPTSSKADRTDVHDMFGKALNFMKSFPQYKSPAEMWADRSHNLNLPLPPNTWTGRRITVRNGDLHTAFQQLNQRLRQNNVAREIALTVRHEKKGDKRARLRSERWRKRFADAVRKKVQLVSTIRRRGG